MARIQRDKKGQNDRDIQPAASTAVYSVNSFLSYIYDIYICVYTYSEVEWENNQGTHLLFVNLYMKIMSNIAGAIITKW